MRQGRAEDLRRVAEVQAGCPEAASWNAVDYLEHDFRVAECGGTIVGFSVTRRTSGDESELLNLAVDPGHRRKGIASALVRDLAARHPGAVFLEVRESNSAARGFYKAFSFEEVGLRSGYYRDPEEAAVVMCFRS